MPTLTLECAFPSAPLAASPSYIDISSYMTAAVGGDIGHLSRSTRGPGVLNVVLDNSTGAFNQWNQMSPFYGNLLTQEQSIFDTGTSGWIPNPSGGNCTLARVATPTSYGSGAMRMTSVASGQMTAQTLRGTSGVPVVVGSTIYGFADLRAATTARTCRLTMNFFNAAGTFLSNTNGTNFTDSTSAYTSASMSVTVPASAAYASLNVQVDGTAAGEQHYVDKAGIGGSASFFSVGGQGGLIQPMKKIRLKAVYNAITYYLFTGYVEEWGAEWEDIDFGDMTVRAVDPSKVLTLVKPVSTAYFDAQMAQSPAGLYRLGETGRSPLSGGTIIAEDSSGNSRDGYYKGSPASFEADGAVASESNTAVDLGDHAGWVELPMAACPNSTGNFAIEALVYPRSFPLTSPFDYIWHVLDVGSQIVDLILQSDGTLRFEASGGVNGGALYSSVALSLYQWNHVVVVKSGTTGPGGGNWNIYVNGVDVSTSPSTYGTGNVVITQNSSLIGGDDTGGVQRAALDGIVDEFAIYHTALSSGDVDTHYDAMFGLIANSLAGARIGNLLDLIGWPAADRVLDTGQFQMQPVAEPIFETPPLAYFLKLVESEGFPAAFFMDGQGRVVFQDRAHSTPATAATFTDSTSFALYYDPGPGPKRSDDHLWTRVALHADGGQPQTAEDAVYASRFIGRTLTRTGLKNASDADVATCATAELTRGKTPRDRIDRLVIHPVDEPTNMWPHALGRELNDVINVQRTDLPGGGTTFTGDFRIEGIEQKFGAQDWYTTWTLEPT